jgi:Domain of unknown function (DUF4149)
MTAARSMGQTMMVTAQLFALGSYAALLFAVGALTAPVIFREIDAPLSGLAMAQVFARMDRGLLLLAASAACMEFALNWPRRPSATSRLSWLRRVAIGLLCAHACLQSFSLTPTIATYHRAGFRRGVGVEGIAMDDAHHLSSRLGSAAAVLCLLAMFSRLRERDVPS